MIQFIRKILTNLGNNPFCRKILTKLGDNPFYEIFQRLRKVYRVGDTATRRRIIFLHVFRVLQGLLQTFLVASVVIMILLLKSSAAIQDNRYVALIYNGLGFTDTDVFVLAFTFLVILAFIIGGVLNFFMRVYLMRFNQLVVQFYMQRTLRLNFSRSYEENLIISTDEMLHKSMGVVQQVISQSISMAARLVSIIINLFVISLALFVLNFIFAVVMFLTLILYYVTIYNFSKRKLVIYSKQMYELRRQKIKVLREGFSGYLEVFLLGKREEYLCFFRRNFVKQFTIQLKTFFLNQIPSTGIKMLVVLILFTVAAFVILGGGEGQDLTGFIISIGAAYRMLPLVAQLYNVSTGVKKTSFQYQKVNEDLEERVDTETLPQQPDEKVFGASMHVRLDHVDYSYIKDPDQPLIIKDLSLSIEPGEVVVLCGRSGAGKTTVARLVSGLVQPDRGKMTVNGLSLKDKRIRQQWYYSLGYIVQKPFFSDDTLAANIAFELDYKKIDFQKVEDVVKKACLNDFVASLPEGLNTPIGKSAVTISGGQAQRLAIARTLYCGAKMLIMDEATNALDSMTAKEVIRSLLAITPRKSFLIISHGMESLSCADRIMVIDDGRIGVQGTYDELLDRSDLFLSLVRQYSKNIASTPKPAIDLPQ